MSSWLFRRQRTFQSIFVAGMGNTKLPTQYSFSKHSWQPCLSNCTRKEPGSSMSSSADCRANCQRGQARPNTTGWRSRHRAAITRAAETERKAVLRNQQAKGQWQNKEFLQSIWGISTSVRGHACPQGRDALCALLPQVILAALCLGKLIMGSGTSLLLIPWDFKTGD